MTVFSDISSNFASVLYFVTFHLTRALLAFTQSDSYLYWPFVLSTLALAMMVPVYYELFKSGRNWSNCWSRLRGYASLALWWHRSARADYRLYFMNALIHPIVIVPLLISNAQVTELLDSLLDTSNGATDFAGSPHWWGARIIFTIIFFVAFDFGRFVSHCLLHDVPALWPFHKVHHSAEVLTPITSYRVHPLELLLMAWIPVLLTGLVTWVFNRWAGGGVTFYSYLGLHALIWAFNLIDNLRHSPVWFSYGQKLGRWLVSPAHHQVHHSIEPRHWGTNRGANLAIWDRLYGTLYVPGLEQENFRMGLGDGTEAQWHRLWTIYVQPFRESFRCVWDAVLRRVGTTS